MNMRRAEMRTAGVFVVALLLLASACGGEIGDVRYDKWRRYTDEADNYVVLIPPDWTASDEVVPGYRGTRFAPTEKYSGDIASFVYYAVMVKDLEDPDADFAEISESTIRDLLRGIWTELELERSAGEFAGKPAMIYEMYGTPLYTEYSLRGQTAAVIHEGKLYLFMASATDGSYEGLAEEFGLIRRSVQLDPEP